MDSIRLWWTLVELHWTPVKKSTGFYYKSTELEQKLWKNCPIGLKMLTYPCANKSPIGQGGGG